MRPWIAIIFCLAGCGARTQLPEPSSSPTPPGPHKVTSLALGAMHSCALFGDGTAACWGYDANGELGDVGSGPDHTTPIALKDAAGIAQIACTAGQTCVVLSDSTLECWGSDNTTTGYVAPVVIGTGFSMVSLGGPPSCGRLTDGTVACWRGFSDPPVAVPGLSDVVEVGVGSTLACALFTSGGVSCWGSGPLGDGTESGSTTPVDVVGLNGPVEQIALGSEHACALLKDRTVACWGSFSGALGVAPPNNSGLVATQVVVPTANRISSGFFQAAVVLEDGTVQHWGSDNLTGPGNTLSPPNDSLTPVAVPGLSSVVDVASGEFHNCALLADAQVECWGENSDGQLGDGTRNSALTPVHVLDLP